MFHVYEHYRPDTNAPFYVGKGNDSRVRYTIRGNEFHKNIRAKLNKNGLKIEVKIVQSFENESDAFCFEKLLIETLRYAGVELTNATDGGEGASGYKHTEEFKNKISLINSGENNPSFGKRPRLGKKHSKESIGKISLAKKGKQSSFLGKRHSDESKKKISTSLTNLMVGESNPFFGKKHSDESRMKMSNSHVGKKASAETRDKMSIAHSGENHHLFGKKHSEKSKEKMRASQQLRRMKERS